jgi:hypothetical protein
MAKQMMIYDRAVPLQVETHRDWSLRQNGGYGFAKEVNSVPLLAAEFGVAAHEMTIIFAGDGNDVFPAVILGMRDGENAHVNKDGEWKGNYVPAFLRRYPFVFAVSEDEQTFTLCIDEEYEGFNNEGKGERLFDSDGNRTKYLQDMLKFVSDYQAQFNRTQLFARKLVELDLLEPAQAQFSLPDGQRTQLAGFKTINREKLRNLPKDKLAELARTDELELAYLHLFSLNNLAPMTRRLSEQGDAKTAA